MELTVDLVTLQGDYKSLKLNSNARIDSLKKVAAQWKETEEQNIWILYKGRLVEEDETAAMCGIKNGEKLRIVVKNEAKLGKGRSMPVADQVPVAERPAPEGRASTGIPRVERSASMGIPRVGNDQGNKPVLGPPQRDMRSADVQANQGGVQPAPVLGGQKAGVQGPAPSGLQPSGLSGRQLRAQAASPVQRNRDPPNPAMPAGQSSANPAMPNKPPGQASAASVKTIVEMGFTQAQAEEALQAANGDLQRAINFLTDGDAGDAGSETNDRLRMIQEQIRQNPALLSQYEMQLKQSPEGAQMEAQQPGTIRKILTGEISLGAPPRQTAPSELTPAELGEIGTIQGMGFSEQQAREAYIAAGRNIELAVNMLMDGR